MQYLYHKLLRPILFSFDPELSHSIALKALSLLSKFGCVKLLFAANNKIDNQATSIASLNFKNRLGIAAGLDKNAEYIDALADLGVGFIEVGTVTPRAQKGNSKPRLFRLIKNNAIINRMGFNNQGLESLLSNIKKSRLYRSKSNNCQSYNEKLPLLGINIGKNSDTPNELAINDYIMCMQRVYQYADYIAVNISSPNTKDLRQLQSKDYLNDFLERLKVEQLNLAKKYGKSKPLALKIAPDLTQSELYDVCDLCHKHLIDIIIISNTTNEHPLLYDKHNNKIAGGLSGEPLSGISNNLLEQAKKYINKLEFTKTPNKQHKMYIIGVGGINSGADAKNKLVLGADLIQVYSGLIYQGPSLVDEIIKDIT